MSQLTTLNMMCRGKDQYSQDLQIPVARNLEFLKEVARRALGLEQARKNAKALNIIAEDYADHMLHLADQDNFSKKVERVTFDCSSGYYYSPHIYFHGKDGPIAFGRISTVQLQAILEMQLATEAEAA